MGDVYVYPRVRVDLGYICRDSVTLQYEVRLNMKTWLRKKGKDGLYYRVRIVREFSFAHDERERESIVSYINHFHDLVYRELIMSIVDPNLVGLTGEKLYVLDNDQQDEDHRLVH